MTFVGVNSSLHEEALRKEMKDFYIYQLLKEPPAIQQRNQCYGKPRFTELRLRKIIEGSLS